jgi:acyl-[acyl-carrier-protein] desaturase
MSDAPNSNGQTIQIPTIVRGPWTLQARQQAVEKECLQHFIEYFGKAMRTRRWSPWHDLPLEEMRAYGVRLSPETIGLIEGFLGVEEYVGDYVLVGMEMFRENRTRRNLQLQWGAEEMKHGAAWSMVLLHSGARTESEIDQYCKKVAEHRWSNNDHPGVDGPLGSAVYSMLQERATYFNYRETRLRIRDEYGLPIDPTPEERRRGYEVGAAQAFHVVSMDEIAHHGIFLKIVQTYLTYLPDQAFETAEKVFRGFKMPALRLIPNAREFLRTTVKVGLQSKQKYKLHVYNPILEALGLEDDEAFNRAVQAAKLLPPGLGPDQVKLGKTGEFTVAFSQECS